MNVYAVRWVQPGAGPQYYNAHENEYNSTDLRGVDFVTCSNSTLASAYVQMARPNAELERPRLLGPAA